MISNPQLNSVARWYTTKKGLNSFMIYCVYEEIKQYIRQPLLEIGAADGYMTQLISANHNIKHYHIVEASQLYAQYLKGKFASVKVINSTLEKYQYEKKYKTIIASHVLEHIPNVNQFLKKAYSLLDDNGYFIVSVPNALSIHRLVGVEMGILNNPYELNEQDKKIGHFRVYDNDKLKVDLEKNKFKVHILTGSFIKFLSNSQTEKVIPKRNWMAYYKVSKRFPQFCSDIISICTK